MKQIKIKEVVLPIKVPSGKYCWEHHISGTCNYFDNEGGHSSCELKFHCQKDTKQGVLKDPACAALVDVLIIDNIS